MTIDDLIEKVEEARGPDRMLDAMIAAEIEPHHFDAPGFTPIRPIPAFSLDRAGDAIRFEGGGIMGFHCFPAVTSSTDEAIKLLNRVLPGWTGFVDIGAGKGTRTADIFSAFAASQTDGDDYLVDYSQEAHGEGATTALAVCAAVLTAMLERREAAGRFRADWERVCDADPPNDPDFIEKSKGDGFIKLVPVDAEALQDPFAAEKGIEPGGSMWRLTPAGRTHFDAGRASQTSKESTSV